MTKVIQADVVVVGSGIAGCLSAYQLASQGNKVAILEQGSILPLESVVAIHESESFMGNPNVTCIPLDLVNGKKISRRYLPSVVGGLAKFYAGVSIRMREKEFERWPISYQEIEPYYSKAEHILQVSGKAGVDPLDPPRSETYVHDLPEMSELSRKLSKGAEALGLKPFQHPFAIQFEKNCIRCNYCNQVPCPYDAKWSPDKLLLENSNLPIRLYDQTSAVKIHWKNKGNKRKIQFIEATNNKDKTVIHFRAKNFVIAGGALFTPKLMILSGFREQNSLVGTHLMTHCLGLVVGLFPFQISEEQDFHKWFSISDYYFDEAGRVIGLIQQDHLTTLRNLLLKVPRALHPVVKKFYYNTCQLLVIAEDEARPENRIDFDHSQNGSVISVHHQFTKSDVKRRGYLVSKARAIMKSAGAIATIRFKGQSVFHACGTCRMGKSAADSVTDSRGRVWGTENLYVADASLMPTSSGVNPSLTIAANALRVADYIE